MSVEPLCWIDLLGGLRVRQVQRTITRFRTQKTGALLAYLAFHKDRVHPREVLIEMFWPDLSPRAGRNSLSIALSSLRGQLEPPGVPTGAVIVADRFAAGLNGEAVWTDVECLEEALRRAAEQRTHSDAPTEQDADRLHALVAAEALYRGPLLPGYYDVWIAPEQERLSEAFLQVLEQLRAAHEVAGDLAAALRPARRAVELDPLREESHRDLIRLLIASNQPMAALRAFTELTRILDETMSAAPSAQTRALIEPLRNSALPEDGLRKAKRASVGTSAARKSPDCSKSRGQNGSSFAPSSSPPSSAQEGAAPAHPLLLPAMGLPARFTRFFGRSEERERVAALLRDPSVRLVTLTGAGGTGKTRLAVEVAQDVRDAFGGALWFLPLADLLEARRLPQVLADVLGEGQEESAAAAEGDPLDRVIAVLCRHAAPLLVLDNFEQLVEGGAAALVRTLLARVPALTCLVTSRQRLLLEAEREFVLAPLPTPDAESSAGNADPERLIKLPSVALFVDRAQAARPDFQITRRNAPAIAELVRRLDGTPLAIELAAARVQVLSPAQMLAQIDRRFDLLVSRRRDVPARHQSLRAAMEWSYRLVSPDLQRFFAALSVFRGGWTCEAAEGVTGDPLALDHLAQLRDASLVLSVESADEIRFSLLETLREFAAEQVNESERIALWRRHAEHFIALAEKAEANLQGPEQGFWLDQLESEYDNLRAVLGRAATGSPANDAGVRTSDGLRLAGALWRFWWMRGHAREGRERIETLLAAATDHANGYVAQDTPAEADRWRARAQFAAGVLARLQGEHEAAGDYLNQALRAFHTLADARGEADTRDNRGLLARRRGDLVFAEAEHRAALAVRRSIEDRAGEARTLHNLGILARALGDLAQAQALYHASLSIERELGNERGVATTLHNLAPIARLLGDIERAHAYYAESIVIDRRLNHKPGLAVGLHGLGFLARNANDWETALELFRESLRLEQETGNRSGIVTSLDDFAYVAAAMGQAERAARLAGAAHALRIAVGEAAEPGDQEDIAQTVACSRSALGDAAFARHFAQGAALDWDEAVALAQEQPVESTPR